MNEAFGMPIPPPPSDDDSDPPPSGPSPASEQDVVCWGGVVVMGDAAIPQRLLALILAKIGPVVFHDSQYLHTQSAGVIIHRRPEDGAVSARLATEVEVKWWAGIPDKKEMH